MDDLKRIAKVDRIRATLVQEEIECDFNQINKAIKGQLSGDLELNARVQSYLKAEKYIEQRVADLNLNNLKKAHEILLRGTKGEKFGGILRSMDGHGDVSDSYELPANEELNDLVGFLIRQIDEKDIKLPIIHALGVYLLFDIVQPFIVNNQTYSLIVFNALLKQMGFDLDGLLCFEKNMLRDWNTHKSIKLNSLFPVEAKDRLGEDLTAFFENCFSILNESYTEIEETIINALKTTINYQSFKPIQKNSFNYFFEMGFKKHYKGILELNERQQAILRDVVFSRTATTKQMVMKYRCDRKTVQRDFSELMNVGILSFEGKTKTVNYQLSFA